MVFYVAVSIYRFCGVVKKLSRIFIEKIRQALVIAYIQEMPVVETRVLKLFVVYWKAHGLDKVKPCSRNGAGAGDISRILRYLRLDKNNIEYRWFYLRIKNYVIILPYFVWFVKW